MVALVTNVLWLDLHLHLKSVRINMKHILFEMHHLKDLIVWAFKLDQTIINSFNDKDMWVQYHKNAFSRIGWALQIWLTYILIWFFSAIIVRSLRYILSSTSDATMRCLTYVRITAKCFSKKIIDANETCSFRHIANC